MLNKFLGQTTRLLRKRKYTSRDTAPVCKQEVLLEKKIELVSLQIDLLKKEHEMRERRNAEKHEVEMAILKSNCQCKKI